MNDQHREKTFSTDWTSAHEPSWRELLGSRRGDVADILEIGSWEGRSAVFWLNFFRDSKLTCIDTFAGSEEHHISWKDTVGCIENRFDQNLLEFSDRVRKLKGSSAEHLSLLAMEGEQYDFIYIDGGHRAFEAYLDATLSWRLLRPGGALLFDDYEWNMIPGEMNSPKRGIEAFLKTIPGLYTEIHRGYQLLIERPFADESGNPEIVATRHVQNLKRQLSHAEAEVQKQKFSLSRKIISRLRDFRQRLRQS